MAQAQEVEKQVRDMFSLAKAESPVAKQDPLALEAAQKAHMKARKARSFMVQAQYYMEAAGRVRKTMEGISSTVKPLAANATSRNASKAGYAKTSRIGMLLDQLEDKVTDWLHPCVALHDSYLFCLGYLFSTTYRCKCWRPFQGW